MADTFSRLLRAGTRFDRKRFGKDIALFEHRGKEETSGTNTSTNAATGSMDVDVELDFFHNHHRDANLAERKHAANVQAAVAKSASPGQPVSGKRQRANGAALPPAGVKRQKPVGRDQQRQRAAATDGDQDSSADEAMPQSQESKGPVQLFRRDANDMDATSPALSGDGDDAAALVQAHAVRQEIAEFRSSHNIHVHGSDVPAPVRSFDDMESSLGVHPYMLQNIRTKEPQGFGYTDPTSIQMQAIPILLAKRELMGVAPTGSGKTASFIIPLLTLLKNPDKAGFRGLILAPTKELADQITRHVKKLAQGRKWRVLCLTKANANANALGNTARRDILISTPMRLVHAVQQGEVNLSSVEYVMLDEADRLFDLGFVDQVDEILAACTHPSRSVSLFSATMFQGVEAFARTIQKDRIRVTIGTRNAAAPTVRQRLVFVGREDGKLLALRQLFQQGIKPPILIFVQSKERAQQLFFELVYDRVNVEVIHAERTQAQRTNILKKFRAGQIWVLICTDLMARGMDLKGVHCVINYDFPQSTASYIHRIGRTGRAGREGEAVTFFTDRDSAMLRSVAEVMRHSGCEVPDWMLKIKKPSKSKQKKIKDAPPPREAISTEIRPKQVKEKKRKKSDDSAVDPAADNGSEDADDGHDHDEQNHDHDHADEDELDDATDGIALADDSHPQTEQVADDDDEVAVSSHSAAPAAQRAARKRRKRSAKN